MTVEKPDKGNRYYWDFVKYYREYSWEDGEPTYRFNQKRWDEDMKKYQESLSITQKMDRVKE